MAGARGIEGLSLALTAGVVAGAFLPWGNPWLASALILPLSVAPVFFPGKLVRAGMAVSAPVFFLSFFLLGVFCALNSFLSPLELSLPTASAGKLRALIDGIPFRGKVTGPLLKALLTGSREDLSRETVAVFRESGASHILALSGLHIGIIYLALDRLAVLLVGNSPAARWGKAVLITGVSAWFTLMTGAAPSIVRAFLFILINEMLTLLSRPRKPVRVLCLALLIQVVLDPSVVKSVGFQLSYLAMAGRFLLYPVLDSWYPPSRGPVRKIWQSAALSISCQMFTGPLAWLRFGTFPRYFILTTLLALPLVNVVMWVGILAVALSAFGSCPLIIVKAADAVCGLLVRILEVIASI